MLTFSYTEHLASGKFTALRSIDTRSRMRLYHDIISYDGATFVDTAFIQQMPFCKN